MASVKSARSEMAAATRNRILDAAGGLFDEVGLSGTRVEDIAERAGVAVPTVYKVFVNKRNLLIAAVRRAMAGGDDSGAIADQPWFLEQLDEPDPGRQLDLVARNARRMYERAGGILEVLRAAARLDDDFATAWDGIMDARLSRSRATATRLLRKAGRRARLKVDETTITLLSLTGPELYAAQIGAGRTPRQYEAWLGHVLRSSLLA